MKQNSKKSSERYTQIIGHGVAFIEKNFYLILILLFVLTILLMPSSTLIVDYNSFYLWTEQIKLHGLQHAYDLKSNNYFPVFNYMLYIFTWIYSNLKDISANIFYMKVPLLAFDFGSVALCAWLLKKFNNPRVYSLLILLNPAFFYNSLLWGQIESIYIFFTVASLVAAKTKHTNWSILLYVFAFYSKLQAIVFIPCLGLLLLPQFINKPKLILEGIITLLLSHVLVLFPFILAGQVGAVYANVASSLDLFPVVSMNAFNFWILVFGGRITITKDATILFIFSYKTWGMILFLLISLVALFPMIKEFFKHPKTLPGFNLDFVYKVFLINALISFIFFYFPTQMHERYLQPAVIFFGMVFLLKPGKISFLTYLILSITYVASLEKVLKAFQFPRITYVLMSPRIMSFTFGIVLVLAFFLLYRKPIAEFLERKFPKLKLAK